MCFYVHVHVRKTLLRLPYAVRFFVDVVVVVGRQPETENSSARAQMHRIQKRTHAHAMRIPAPLRKLARRRAIVEAAVRFCRVRTKNLRPTCAGKMSVRYSCDARDCVARAKAER